MRHNTLFIIMLITCNAYGSNNPKAKAEDILPQGIASKFTAGHRFHAVKFVPKPHPKNVGDTKFMMKNTYEIGFEMNEVQRESMLLGTKLVNPVVHTPAVPNPSTKPSILDVDKSAPDAFANNNVVKRHVYQPSKRKKPSILDVDVEIPAVQETSQIKRTLDPLAPETDSKRTKVEESIDKTRHKVTLADILNPDWSDNYL